MASVPMTTTQIEEKKLSKDDTCSWPCEYCKERVWFIGGLSGAPIRPECPYCGKRTWNPMARRRK